MGPNALTFILKLQDMLTPGMRQAAGISESSANKIKSQFTGLEYSGKRMGASVNELKERLESINQIRVGTTIKKEFNDATTAAKVLERQIQKLENTGKEKASGGGFTLGKMIAGNLISGGIARLTALGASGLSSIVSASVAEEQAKVGLKTFLGEKGANDAYANIKKDAAVTPFDTSSLLASNRALISAGLSAKAARQDTLNLANAVAAVGGGNDVLARMSANMQQIKTVGKATAMDIRQFGMTGINIYQLLADVTGKNIDQVKEMDVSYSLLSKALQRAGEKGGMYFGAMENQSKTIGGKWSTFMDNLKNTAADIGTALQPLFHWFLDLGISDNFSKIMPIIQPVIDVINQIPGIIANITSGSSEWSEYFNVIKSFAGKLWETIKSIWGNVIHIVSGVGEWLGKSEMMKDIFWAIGQIAQGVLAVIRGMVDALSWIWDHLLKPILNAVDWVYSKMKGLLGGGNSTITVTADTHQALKEGVQVQEGTAGAMVFQMPKDTVSPKSLNPTRPTSSKLADTDLGKTKADSINQGGQRSIVINIGKQIEKIEQHIIGGGREAADEIEGAVREAMRRVVYSLNGVAS